MNVIKVLFAGFVAIALLTSCADEAAQKRIVELDKKVTEQGSILREITDKLDAATEHNGKLSETIEDVENKLKIWVQMQRLESSFAPSPEPYALIDPHQKGFASVKTANGSLLVSIADIQPHLDGFKLTLQIGNPYNMAYSGFAVSMRCGSPPPVLPAQPSDDENRTKEVQNWVEQYGNWKNGLKTKSAAYTDLLLPGKWSTVEFILAPVGNADLAFMQIAITTNEVKLHPSDP